MLLLLAAGAPGALTQAPKRQTLVCFGDSLTAGYGAPSGQSYPDYLESYLIEQGLRPRVVNAGVSGDTTKDGLSRLPSVLALRPDVVVLELGANDGLRGTPPSVITTNLSTIIEALQKVHARVVLAGMYMPPNYGPDYVKPFQAIYPALAHKYRLPLLPFILAGVYSVPGMMSGDGVHPNGQGYQIVARSVLPFVTPLLHK